MKRVNIVTLQMGKWRVFKDNPNIELCDVTFMSKNKLYKDLFAPPDFDMVKLSKAGELSESAYLKKYLSHIYKTSRDRREDWNSVLDKGNLALLCFCKDGKFCHRHSLKDYLVHHALSNGYEIGFTGELTEENRELILAEINNKDI